MRQLDTETRQRVQRVLDRAKAEGRDPVQMLYDYGLLMAPSFVARVKADALREAHESLVVRNWQAGNPTAGDVAATCVRVIRELEESYRVGV